MKTAVNWNDSTFTWGGPEDFLWNDAYRTVNNVVVGSAGWEAWEQPAKKVREKFKPEVAEKFLRIVIEVNGLHKTFSKSIKDIEKTITVEHIQKTFDHFGIDTKSVNVTVKNVNLK